MTADDIQAAVDMLQDKLKKLKAERPVIICPEGHKELYERYFPEANVIVNPAVSCKLIRVFYAVLTKGIDYDRFKMMTDIHRNDELIAA